MNWGIFFAVLLAIGIGWLTYRGIRNNPQAFSKQNTSKSIRTLGLLALFLIVIIGLAVLTLRG